MKKFDLKKISPGLTLFIISVIVTLVLTFITYVKGRFLVTMSNNFFVVGTVYMTVGIIFEIIGWSQRKKHIRKPISKEELEEIKYSHKDAGVVSSINKEKEAERRKKIYGMLWKIFVLVGFADFAFSVLILLFIK